MANKLDKMLIVDPEATCWEGSVPEGMESEIIEVGICLLDVQTYEISDNLGILVKPARSTVSTFCTELTTITQQMVDDQGISLKEACSILKQEYLSQSRVWASFGAYDLKQFQRECTAKRIGYPFGPSHMNVKTLFAIKKKLGRELGMAGALEMLNIPLEGTHHRGVDDANNIAKILRSILNE